MTLQLPHPDPVTLNTSFTLQAKKKKKRLNQGSTPAFLL